MQVIRHEYLSRLESYRNKQLIKVITGIRRCGKSTLLEQYRNRLLALGVSQQNIVSVNFEDFDFEELCDPRRLHGYIKNRLSGSEMTYVFLDEIQNVPDFPKVIDSLYIRNNIDIYITGSNAKMLSSEIATLLSGRYVQIEMLPFSFKEYVSARGTENLSRKFRAYLEDGSFPYTLAFDGRKNEIREYLEGIFNTIIVKDIAQRKRFVDPMMLKSVLRFVFDNVGNMLSSKKIADTMTSAGRKIDAKTVERYLGAFTESYVVYTAQRYDIKGKQYLKTLEKYYIADTGLRSVLLGSKAADMGHILENVVYLELLRRRNKVFVGRFDDMEVDFVAESGNGISYWQVAATARDEKTLERELAPLLKIKNSYPKFLLTLDDDPNGDYDGIRKLNVLDWLLG